MKPKSSTCVVCGKPAKRKLCGADECARRHSREVLRALRALDWLARLRSFYGLHNPWVLWLARVVTTPGQFRDRDADALIAPERAP